MNDLIPQSCLRFKVLVLCTPAHFDSIKNHFPMISHACAFPTMTSTVGAMCAVKGHLCLLCKW